MLAEPVAAAAIDWATALTVAALPEQQPYPEIYDTLEGVLDAISLAPVAREWAAALVRFELLMLARLGFGLSLDKCVVSGATTGLAFVSPKSAGAVSVAAAAGYEERLLPLPSFLIDGCSPKLSDTVRGFELSGYFLETRLFDRRRSSLFVARDRLIDRLRRMLA